MNYLTKKLQQWFCRKNPKYSHGINKYSGESLYDESVKEARKEIEKFYADKLNDYDKAKDLQIKLALGQELTTEEANFMGLIKI